jgi:transcriptional regulator with XRE-family HTH domain
LANSDKTQSALAAAAGVSNGQVTRWKDDGQQPSGDAIKKIADFFDVNPLRLTVTAGIVPPEVAGVEKLPLPDMSARRNMERQALRETIMKKLSGSGDREYMLAMLEVLRAGDGAGDARSESGLPEALDRVEKAVDVLTKLLESHKPRR